MSIVAHENGERFGVLSTPTDYFDKKIIRTPPLDGPRTRTCTLAMNLFSAVKGGAPVNMSYIRAPRDHQSTA